MSAVNYQTPGLASVLKTLAQFVPAQSSLASTPRQPPPAATSGNAAPEPDGEGDYEPPDVVSVETRASEWQSGPSAPAKFASDHTGSSVHEPTKRPAPIDPSTILDWPNALRCVMKTVARNDEIIAKIRKMIHVQHEHEKQWWEGRQALLKKQEARVEGRKKLDDVLRAVGGKVAANTTAMDTEDHARELTLYDRKVHRASVEMVKAMNTGLKEMGVPFFGTQQHLIDRRPVPHEGMDGGDVGTSSGGKTIHERELVNLQRKMLDMLQDICAE